MSGTNNAFWGLMTGLLLLLAQPVAAQVYYEFLPDSMGARLLRQAQVRELRWTLADLRYNSNSLYRVVTLDGHGGMHFRDGNEPEPEVKESANAAFASAPAARQLLIQRDARGRPTLELRPRPGGGYDTATTFRYSLKGDTTWEITRQYGSTHIERHFWEGKDHRLLRYDRLQYGHPKHYPELPEYLKEVKSYYLRFDNQHRQVEDGEVNYEPALEEWMSRRMDKREGLPGGFRQFVYGGGMYQLQLKGQLKGEYRPTKRVYFDKKGRLAATWSYYSEGLRRFRFNAAGQVVEVEFFSQEKPDGPVGAATGGVGLEWGTAGLPVRVELRSGAGEAVQISTYTYAHFLGPPPPAPPAR